MRSSVLDRQSILSSTAIVGDTKAQEAYNLLMRHKWGIRAKFDIHLPRGSYGEDLDLILLEFYVEGGHNWFKMPNAIALGRYTKKDKSISVKIPMKKAVSDSVSNGNETETRAFILDVFGEVRRQLLSSKPIRALDFNAAKFSQDYDALLHDISAGPQY